MLNVVVGVSNINQNITSVRKHTSHICVDIRYNAYNLGAQRMLNQAQRFNINMFLTDAITYQNMNCYSSSMIITNCIKDKEFYRAVALRNHCLTINNISDIQYLNADVTNPMRILIEVSATYGILETELKTVIEHIFKLENIKLLGVLCESHSILNVKNICAKYQIPVLAQDSFESEVFIMSDSFYTACSIPVDENTTTFTYIAKAESRVLSARVNTQGILNILDFVSDSNFVAVYDKQYQTSTVLMNDVNHQAFTHSKNIPVRYTHGIVGPSGCVDKNLLLADTCKVTYVNTAIPAF